MQRPSLQRAAIIVAISLVLVIPASFVLALDLTGRVTDGSTGEPLPAASVRLSDTGQGAVSDSSGRFEITRVAPGSYTLTASFVGYLPFKTQVTVPGEVQIPMQPTVLPGEEVVVTTTRAARGMPITHSNMTGAQIDREHTVQDVPMLLAQEPGIYAYSDAGNGVGYSYLQIRGFEQRKVGVYVNGVPLNDPTSHAVYWVDLPDILESASDIQIQRGVGNSLYGASAPGGVVSMELQPFTVQPRFRMTAGLGSYGTRKFSMEGSSGLIEDTYSLYGRFSRLVSDGYRDQSWSDVFSYFLGLARYDRRLTNRFFTFGGPEHLHVAWDGIDRAQLQADRRYNPLSYEKETDTFNQPHYQWLTDWQITDRVALANTAFYVKGDGYFIQDKAGSDFTELDLDTSGLGVTEGDAVVQRHVQNDFFGVVPRLTVEHARGRVTVGGEVYRHAGYHFGEVLSIAPAPADFKAGHDYYNYDVRKLGATLFLVEHYAPTKRLRLMGALQYQWKRYEQRNDRRGDVAYNVDYSFLTPRLGVSLDVTTRLAAYGNVSLARHEPIADEVYDPQDFEDPSLFFKRFDDSLWRDPLMQPEKMTNVELGMTWRQPDLDVAVNGFHQYFTDEIVPGGGLDDDGNPIRANAGKSVHRGLEAEARYTPLTSVELWGNATLSDNYFKQYIERFDPANPVNYSGNTISSFPNFIANLGLDVRHSVDRLNRIILTGGVRFRNVGRIYLDNSETDSLSIDPYAVLDLRAGVEFSRAGKPLEVELAVNNVTSELYETFGYVYGTAYFWPAAERNYFLRVRTSW